MNWRSLRASILVFLITQLVGGLLSGCTAPEVLTTVLGPPVKSEEAKVHLRRPEYKPWKEFTMMYDLKPPDRADWAEKLALLPKTDDGEINWGKAYKDGMIKPKPGLGEKAEDQDTEDSVLVLTPKGFPNDKATYPHLPHTQVLACSNCHPAIFKMEAGADPITMKAINKGEFCGRCHGPVAFGASNCELCHLENAG